MTEFVLRLHCPNHPEVSLLEMLVEAGRCPQVAWPGELLAHELGDMGNFNGLAMPEGYASDRPITFVYVVGPAYRGAPGSRPDSLPADWGWDEVRGLGIAPDRPAWSQVSDQNAAKDELAHLRYTIQHPDSSCGYRTTITRPNLFALLDWLAAHKYQLAAWARTHPTWQVVAHDLYVDSAATHATEWTDEESSQGWREWLPTVTLDAELDGLLREWDLTHVP